MRQNVFIDSENILPWKDTIPFPMTFTIVPMYIHLATHSAFSLQEGLMPPADLVQAAGACDMPALGLTDHHPLTGAIEFVKACKEAGIQPFG
jgi:DNA polymerase III alpha subunit